MSADARPVLNETDKKLKKVSNSFCLAKWLQVSLHLESGQTHSCYLPSPHKIPLDELAQNPSALHNTKEKLQQRQQMLAGQKPKGCNFCWNLESLGQFSERHFKSSETWAEPYFKDVVDSGLGDKINPKYLEVSFSNECNFKCAYCSPQFSSRLMNEILKYGEYPSSDRLGSIDIMKSEDTLPTSPGQANPYVDAFWSWWPTLVKNLLVFRITGGEPLLSTNTWRVFDFLRAEPQPQLEFAINSNMGVSEANISKLIEAANGINGKVKNFTLYTSLDTVGKQAEYIRFGLNFEKFNKNVDRVLSEVNYPFKLVYIVTINALSLPGMKKLLEQVIEQRQKYPHIDISVSTPHLMRPPQMSLRVLPREYVKYLDECIEFMKDRIGSIGFTQAQLYRLERTRAYMLNHNTSKEELNQWRRDFYLMFTEYDRRKGTNFNETFAEYRKFMKVCKWADRVARIKSVKYTYKYLKTKYLGKQSQSLEI